MLNYSCTISLLLQRRYCTEIILQITSNSQLKINSFSSSHLQNKIQMSLITYQIIYFKLAMTNQTSPLNIDKTLAWTTSELTSIFVQWFTHLTFVTSFRLRTLALAAFYHIHGFSLAPKSKARGKLAPGLHLRAGRRNVALHRSQLAEGAAYPPRGVYVNWGCFQVR